MTTDGLRSGTRFTRDEVRRIIDAVTRLVGPDDDYRDAVWTRPELSGALVEVIDPVDAEDVARQILRSFPTPPTSIDSSLVGLVGAMLAPPRIIDFTERASSTPSRFGAPALDDVGTLASWLNVTVDELDWFADRRGWLRTSTPRLQHYRVHRIPKRHGGFRVIEAPKERLATLQRRILTGILANVPPHPAAHGFVRGRSPASFAGPHSLHDTVIRVDLQHCFSHVTVAQVAAVFSAIGYRASVARYLACLCTTATAPRGLPVDDPIHAGLLRARHVPQGAPTSPALVNLALRRLDFRLAGYASKNALTYTRYGDDLGFSGDDLNVGRTLWVVAQVIADEGFTVHPDKVRVMGDHQRQQLAGLVVNAGPRARRSDFDALKALLRNAIATGASAQNRLEHPDFRSYVYGRIGWVATGSPSRRRALLEMAERVDWER